MDPYNTMTLPYMGSPTQMQDLQNPEYYGLHGYDQSQTYDPSKTFTNYAPYVSYLDFRTLSPGRLLTKYLVTQYR